MYEPQVSQHLPGGKTMSVHTAQIGDEHEKCMTPSLACLLASDTGYPLGNLSSSKSVRRRRA